MFLILSNSVITETSSYNSRHPDSNSVPSANDFENSCSGARVMKVAPKRVSGLVVNTLISSPEPSTVNIISAPSERPIQSFCIAVTFSGKSISSNPSTNC